MFRQVVLYACTRTTTTTKQLRNYSIRVSSCNSSSQIDLIKSIESRVFHLKKHVRVKEKQLEFRDGLVELKNTCSQLTDESESKLNELSWNLLIQYFTMDDNFDKEAIYWFERIMMGKQLVVPNSFTLNAIIKSYSKLGDLQQCREIIKELERTGYNNVYSYMHYINSLIKKGNLEEAVEVIEHMKSRGVKPNFGIYIPLLKEVTNNNNMKIGLKLYEMIRESDLASQSLSMSIVTFALKLKVPDIAIEEFEKMKRFKFMNVISWTCLIQAYIQKKDINKALDVLHEMKENGNNPDSTTLTILLNVCANAKLFEKGIEIIELADELLTISNELTSSIVNFYIKTGYSDIAISQCEKIKQRGSMDLILWTYLIQAYIQKNEIQKAIDVLIEMKEKGIDPSSKTFTILLTACTDNFEQGEFIIELAKKLLKDPTPEFYNATIKFYIKNGYPDNAILEFEKMKREGLVDNISWNCIMQAYIQKKDINKSIDVLHEMKENGTNPDSASFIILLTASANAKMYEQGKFIIDLASKSLSKFSVELSTTILNFYIKTGYPDIAIKEFEGMKLSGLVDVISWNCLIQAYIQKNDINQAFDIVTTMRDSRYHPDPTTFIILLTACTNLKMLDKGKSVIEFAKNSLSKFNIELSTAIVNFYIKCGYLDLAIKTCETMKRQGVMNLISWTCLIQSYVQKNDVCKAFIVFREMKENGIIPDSTIFTILLTACTNSKMQEKGIYIIDLAEKSLTTFSIELSTTIINFYIKFGYSDLAIENCEKMKQNGLMDVVTWNCLIKAHIESVKSGKNSFNNHGLNKAFQAYNQMMKQNIEPNNFTYNILLSACGEYIAPAIGLKVIEDVKLRGMDIHEEIISGIVYFYSRIGNQVMAQQLFDNLLKKVNHSNESLSTLTYNNMLSCYAQHGKGVQAHKLFCDMVEKQVMIDEATFTILLNAYSHCGMVSEAIKLYQDMKVRYDFHPTITIDCVMIDVFARAGRLKEAEQLINNREDIELWSSLMGGCRKVYNIELGETVFNKITSIDENNPAPYILLSNIYSYHGMSDKAYEIRLKMKEKGLKKIPGIVSHEENGKVYQFISGSTTYDRFEEVENKRNEKVMDVEIIVRDANRYHHFKDGKCSCNGYW